MAVICFLIFEGLSPAFSQNNDTAKRPAATVQPAPPSDTAHPAAPKPAAPAKDTTSTIVATFSQKEKIIAEEDIVTNVLRLENHTGQDISFTVKIGEPFEWTDLNNDSVPYTLKPGDSLFIPVRVIPAADIKGGADYIISAYMLNVNGTQITSAYFYAHTPKILRWQLYVLPQNRIYFQLHQDTTSFQVRLMNEGNQPEDIVTTLKNTRKQGLITDVTGKIVTSNYYDITLLPQTDTTLPFKVRYTQPPKNFRILDVENYNAGSNTEAKSFSIWVTSQEARKIDSGSYVNSKQVTFVKLPDQLSANPYSSEVFPLTVDLNAYDILGIQPMMNLNVYGNAFLDNEAHLLYAANVYYSSYFWRDQYFRTSTFYAGYFDKRGDDIQIGNIGMPYAYGLALGGLGARGDYFINKQNTVGGFIAEQYNDRAIGFSAWDKYRFMNVTPILNNELFTTSVSGIIDNVRQVNSYSIAEAGGLNITKTQNINFMVSGIERNYTAGPNPVKFLGGTYEIGYNGSFINHRLIISDNFYRGAYDTNVSAKKITNIGNYDTFILNQKWSFQLSNTYNSYQTPFFPVTPTTLSLSNYLFFIRSRQNNGNFVPFIFYNYFAGENAFLQYRGIGGRYSYYNYDANFMVQAGVQGGYNQLTKFTPSVYNYFTAQPNLLIRYHTFSILAFYTYGPLGIPLPNTFTSLAYPQQLLVSLHYQYQFLNKHLVLDNALSYSYYNQNQNNSIGFYPQLYYFSNSGYRFLIGANFNFNSTAIQHNSIYTYQNYTGGENNTPVQTTNVYLNVGIKKTFGIPIPKKWAKHEFRTVLFIAFLDLDGNGKKAPNEAVVDNVVVHAASKMRVVYEALTNDKGEAKMINMATGSYFFSATPLRDMSGWFLSIPDSIEIGKQDTVYIPFTRGVKMFGAVTYHPGKFSVLPKIDLSHIQITATDSAGHSYAALTNATGEFVIYVPAGKYVVTMNEDWMDGNFKVAQNNVPLTLTNGIESIYQSFYVTEKQTGAEIKQFGQPPANDGGNNPH